jgi:hypothetical protein
MAELIYQGGTEPTKLYTAVHNMHINIIILVTNLMIMD